MNAMRRNMIVARRYLLASLLLAVAGAVYEMFSHGVYSNYMIYAFTIPLVLGCLPHLLDNKGVFEAAGQITEKLLLAAVSTLSAGSLIKGVLEIYGTTNSLTIIYPVVGGILMAICTILLFGGWYLVRAKGR